MDSRLAIVLVEDHDDLRETLAEILAERGHIVRALDCAEALADDEDARARIDVLIVDVNLPGENGLHLAQRMRAVHPHLGIIVASARTAIVERVEGYKVGADLYMPKPVSPAELISAVESLGSRVLRTRALAGAAAVHEVTLDSVRQVLRGPVAEVDVTEGESVLLATLARAPAQELESWQPVSALGDEVTEKTVAALVVRMVRLRRKLQAAGAEAPGVRALRGRGYALTCPVRVL